MTDLISTYTSLARMQDATNKLMASPDWVRRASSPQDDVEANRMPLDYGTAIAMEAFELAGSAVAYKWWAPAKLDVRNATMELVDILHFALSLELVDSSDTNFQPDYETVALNIIRAWEASAGDTADFSSDNDPTVSESDIGSLALLNNAVMTLAAEATLAPCSENFWTAFWIVAQLLDVTPYGLANIYKAKAALNRFRTLNGALAGTYVKMWKFSDQGPVREDNAWLLDYVIGQASALTEEQLDTWLAAAYASRSTTL